MYRVDRGQFDHWLLSYGLDGNLAGRGGATFLQLQHALPNVPDFLAQFSMCGCESAHGPALLLQVGQRLQAVFSLESIPVGVGLTELGVQGGPGRSEERRVGTEG